MHFHLMFRWQHSSETLFTSKLKILLIYRKQNHKITDTDNFLKGFLASHKVHFFKVLLTLMHYQKLIL